MQHFVANIHFGNIIGLENCNWYNLVDDAGCIDALRKDVRTTRLELQSRSIIVKRFYTKNKEMGLCTCLNFEYKTRNKVLMMDRV